MYIRILFLFILAFSILGCSRNNDLNWEEEILLPDGKRLIVKRVQHFDEGGYLAGHEFEFVNPESNQIVKWSTDGFYRLSGIYIQSGIPYIVVTPNFAIHQEQAGCPYPRVIIFRYDNGIWQQVPYSDFPIKKIKGNATLDPKSSREEILLNNRKLPAEKIKYSNHPSVTEIYGIDKERFPGQIFECKQRQKINIQ